MSLAIEPTEATLGAVVTGVRLARLEPMLRRVEGLRRVGFVQHHISFGLSDDLRVGHVSRVPSKASHVSSCQLLCAY